MREIRQGACGAIRPINRAPTIGGVARPGAWRLTGPCGRPGLALWEAGSAGRMGSDLVLWEPGSAGRMEAEGLPAVVADEGDPPGRLQRHSPDKSGSHNRWGGSAGRLAADWTLWEEIGRAHV